MRSVTTLFTSSSERGARRAEAGRRDRTASCEATANWQVAQHPAAAGWRLGGSRAAPDAACVRLALRATSASARGHLGADCTASGRSPPGGRRRMAGAGAVGTLQGHLRLDCTACHLAVAGEHRADQLVIYEANLCDRASIATPSSESPRPTAGGARELTDS